MEHRNFWLMPSAKSCGANKGIVDRSFRLSPSPPIKPVTVDELREAAGFMIVQQLVLLGITVLLLDGGGAFRNVTIACLAQWTFVLMFLFRASATRFDLYFIKYGIWPLGFVVQLIIRLMHG